ncbi:hypothetical protein [Chryseobacterium indoltheticum]|uniref:Uncharacterized protein n=1 Tax=Chryseobacterium indoltheticum TaxID=254 RepID=A0A381FAA0_9FLAO|nr:hypothetical protein [Chryseobacterium indoltheticum]AZA73562.1 hypothetical protein EG358_07250 [Chryseobacterium indoltheticum]SIR24295.1 hypothetical protein SAMN05421682_11593 [Chryseobacterium indoltheticum]SUX43509.1 Uncharacterised protein [Chryseobacterium indoltheticum]
MLNGKAKNDFIIWALDNKKCNNPHVEYWYNITVDKGHLSSLIIDWLDSVEIFISIQYVDVFNDMENKQGFEAYVTQKPFTSKFRCVNSRHEALKLALHEANEKYNSRP